MITSGFGLNENLSTGTNTEIIDLKNPTAICEDLPDFPKEVFGPVGGLLGKTPIVCSGSSRVSSTKECFTFNGHSFTRTRSLSKMRAFAASVVTESNKFWVFGGDRGSTEFITEDGLSSSGPDMPDFGIDRHSATNINSTTSIIIGGAVYRNGKSIASPDTYYFHHPTKQWIQGPGLNVGRVRHTSGLVTDTVTNEKYVVVVGGFSWIDGHLASTEILMGGEWITGNV